MYDFHNFALTPEQDLVVNIAILSSLVFAILKGEKKLQHSNPLMILALVTAFCVAGRILLQPLPNIQPVTVTIILVGIYYRSPWAIVVSGVVALSTNLIPWTWSLDCFPIHRMECSRYSGFSFRRQIID